MCVTLRGYCYEMWTCLEDIVPTCKSICDLYLNHPYFHIHIHRITTIVSAGRFRGTNSNESSTDRHNRTVINWGIGVLSWVSVLIVAATYYLFSKSQKRAARELPVVWIITFFCIMSNNFLRIGLWKLKWINVGLRMRRKLLMYP